MNATSLNDQEDGENALLEAPLVVVNVGLERFATDIQDNGAPTIHVAWQPPAGGDPALASILAELGC